MVDTRCANPAYQLDVDTMMIEYVSYKAILSQLQLLQSMIPSSIVQNNGVKPVARDDVDEAARLTQTFEMLIALFKHHHGNDKISDRVSIDTAVLDFLLLLNLWLQQKSSQSPRFVISEALQQKWPRNGKVNCFFRRCWLRNRHAGDCANELEAGQSDRHVHQNVCLADHLLPSFMHLSESMRPPDSALSEKWMQIALEFMSQASLEILSSGTVLRQDVQSLKTAIEACFAWGYIKQWLTDTEGTMILQLVDHVNSTGLHTPERATDFQEYIKKIAQSEEDCSKMFLGVTSTPIGSDGGHATNPPGELPAWTKARAEGFDEVLTTLISMQEESGEDSHQPVRWMRNRHPVDRFLQQVAGFIFNSWSLIHSNQWLEKPILVQIEEGAIAGLDQAEFEQFKMRAGIYGGRSPLGRSPV